MNSIEQDMLNRAGKQLSDDIDKQVLTSVGLGYVFDFYLEYSKGKVYGQEYLTVAPMNAEGLWPDMMTWMVETFGPSGTPENPGCWSPNQRWYANNAKFWFRDQKDRDWFVLRWS
jgi:hypothetical protein